MIKLYDNILKAFTKQKYFNFWSCTQMLTIHVHKCTVTYTKSIIMAKRREKTVLVVATERSCSPPLLQYRYIWKQEVIEVKQSHKSGP